LISYDDRALPLPRHLSESDLLDRLFKHLPDRSRRSLTAAFQERKWQFSAPAFEDGSFQVYEEGTILPYLKEQRINGGGFSNVFKVEIHPHYCSLDIWRVSCPQQSLGYFYNVV
jgi:serine/threonine protein kinase